MIRMFRHGIFSVSVLMEKVLVAARNAWAHRIVTFRSSVSAVVPKLADSLVETSIKYDMIGSLKIAEDFRSIVSSKLLVFAEGVISGARRDRHPGSR